MSKTEKQNFAMFQKMKYRFLRGKNLSHSLALMVSVFSGKERLWHLTLRPILRSVSRALSPESATNLRQAVLENL